MIVRLLTRLAFLALLLSTLATAAALGARVYWILELFAHFRVQYLVMQVLTAGICLGLRRPAWAMLAVLAAVPNVLSVAPYLPGLFRPAATAVAGSGPRTITLVAANLYYRQEDATAARAYLARQSADILVLSEYTPRWREKLQELEQVYPQFVIRTRWSPWGIAVFSKYPLRVIEDLDLGDERSANLRLVVQLPDGLAEIYAVHLMSPPGPGQAARRNTQLRKLAARIAAADPGLPKIVAGDFNTTQFSPYFSDLLRDAGLADGGLPFGLQVTWPTWPVPLWIPIDHCLARGAVTVTRLAVGPGIGSDHWPLECSFVLAS